MPKPRANPSLAPQLTPVEYAAIGIVAKRSKDWREHLDVGAAQPVDVLLRIDGTVTVADLQTAKIKGKPELEDLLAALFAVLGPRTLEKAEAHLLATPRVEPPLEARARAKALIERLTVITEQTRYGNVTGQLALTKFPTAALPLARF